MDYKKSHPCSSRSTTDTFIIKSKASQNGFTFNTLLEIKHKL
jgi:hypothetical protein